MLLFVLPAMASEGGLDLSPMGIWNAMGVPSRVVLITMVLMLLACVYVASERILFFIQARSQSRALASAIGAPLKNNDIPGALKLIAGDAFKKSYLGVILGAGLREYSARNDHHGIAAATRALDTVTMEEGAALRNGMNILATTGSTAPFVGLVGTIFGIINAFSMMKTEGGADIASLSGSIGEALVSTAVGIAVAIIAIWFYNYFNAVIDEIMKDVAVSSAELTDWFEKDVLRRADASAAK